MSHYRNHGGGGGGRRRNYRDEDERIGREVYETRDQRIRNAIIRFGEVDPELEMMKVAKELRELHAATPSIPIIAEGFRIGVTEEPYKIPHFATLLRALDETPESTKTADALISKLVLDDFWKGFQAFLDKLAWREVRLCVHFFAHLTIARVISASSMIALLQSFTAVLEEFGVSHSRAKNAALCAAEGLMRAGTELKAHSASDVTAVISALQTYAEQSSGTKLLASPFARLHSQSDSFEGAAEVLDTAIGVLKSMDKTDFADASISFLHPYLGFVRDDEDLTPYFDLPSVLVPPEVIELENLADGSVDNAPVQKNEEWPEYRLRIFDNDVTADPTTVLGYAVSTLLSDVVDIFEVNRRDCARLLLEIPKWVPLGTFRSRANGSAENATEGPMWQLESCVMESILAKSFVIPRSTYKSVYYIALITELCKAQPQTTGPAVGKSIRKMYHLLSDGLDVEVARRFTDWFATHMSNFGFQWVWKEWIPDLSLTKHHPKKDCIRRAIDTEIRLAYFDRIQKTLPEPYQAPDADVVPDQAPGPEFDYDDPLKPHHDVAQSLLNLLRGRAKADDVNAHIETMKNTIMENSEGEHVNADAIIRSITIQSLLNIGSRSFSHFLNAIERYLPVLRNLSNAGPDAKMDILVATADFWRKNTQMVRIVFDKLMQYQIADPSDVIAWAFTYRGSSGEKGRVAIDRFKWEAIEGALDKANGRVLIARRKVNALQKEQDDSRAKEMAIGNMEVDADGAPAEGGSKAADSPALTAALKAFSTLTTEQRGVLSKTLNEFVNTLEGTGSILTESSWYNRANWTDEDWQAWETWGWYRHFCRIYAPYLRSYSTSLATVAFSKVESNVDEASELIKRVFDVSTGQEA